MAITPSVGGQTTFDVTAAKSLFLKVFSGEVMTAYERAIKVSPLLTTRTITSGKSAQFPTTGVAAARYFQAGDDLFSDTNGDGKSYLSSIKQSERVIHIDDLLTASCFIDQLDEAMSHYDYRAAFATELGRALARHQDNYAIQTLFASSVDVNNVASETTPGGVLGNINDSDFYGSATSALATIYSAAQKMDEADVPSEDRYVVLPPIAYYNLVQAGVLSVGGHVTSDARPRFNGGVRAEGPMTIGGMSVIVTNADGFTSADEADDGAMLKDSKSGEASAEDFGSRNLAAAGNTPNGAPGGTAASSAVLQAICFHKSAAGCVKLKDLTLESEYIIEKQGTLMVAKMAQGMGALRNDGVVCVLDA